MNGIQAVYLLPSLYEEIDISIVRMELWTFDPYNNYQVQNRTAGNKMITIFLINEGRRGKGEKLEINGGFEDIWPSSLNEKFYY